MTLAFANVFDDSIIQNIQHFTPSGFLIGKPFTGNVVFTKPITILHMVVDPKVGMFIFTVSGRLGGIIGTGSGTENLNTPK